MCFLDTQITTTLVSNTLKKTQVLFQTNLYSEMSLHILRHKKWHVWNQDNEDIYTRDENAFMAKVEAEEKQQRMADMESRIQQMKAQRGIKQERTHPIEGSCCRLFI